MPFGLNVLLSSTRDPGSLAAEIRQALGASGFARFPVTDYTSLSARVESSRSVPRFQTALIGVFAISALLLAAIGIYGTLAFNVRSRSRELGIRMAIGAQAKTIHALVMRQGFTVLAAGVIAGLAGALALTRLLQGFLFRVQPLDPLAFLAAVLVVILAVLLASLPPARRAARIDPTRSIREVN